MLILNSMGSLIFSHHVARSVTLHHSAGQAVRQLSLVDRNSNPVLLLEGGADINPALYGEENMYSLPSPYRDAKEVALAEEALKLGIPIIGICRGHQLLTAIFGGTLYQDLEAQYQGHHEGIHDVLCHDVMREKYGSHKIVNSYHHQGTKDKPSNGIVTASHATDGLIEGLWYPKERVMSVQWHPEFMDDKEWLEWVGTLLYPETKPVVTDEPKLDAFLVV